MTSFTRRDLPADIAVFAGAFASQPLAFAHLLDATPLLDLTHVEVIREVPPDARLRPYFASATVDAITRAAAPRDTIVLILPAAYAGRDCPLGPTDRLAALGTFRGTVPHMVAP